MCLAIPARVIERRPDQQALVDVGGVRTVVSVALVPEAEVGDYVIVHVGHAIGRVDAEEAERTLALFAELAREAAPEAAPEAASEGTTEAPPELEAEARP